MLEYDFEFFKNIYNSKYLERNASIEENSIINKIKKTSDTGPFINFDIAELIEKRLKFSEISDEELKEYIRKILFYIKKGNPEEIYSIIKKK